MQTITENQARVMQSLQGNAGQIVEVITSQYDANIDQAYRKRAIFLGTTTRSTLEGLERKGFISDLETFWKGARFRVVKEWSGD